jgi:hypothetical protein
MRPVPISNNVGGMDMSTEELEIKVCCFDKALGVKKGRLEVLINTHPDECEHAVYSAACIIEHALILYVALYEAREFIKEIIDTGKVPDGAKDMYDQMNTALATTP